MPMQRISQLGELTLDNLKARVQLDLQKKLTKAHLLDIILTNLLSDPKCQKILFEKLKKDC